MHETMFFIPWHSCDSLHDCWSKKKKRQGNIFLFVVVFLELIIMHFSSSQRKIIKSRNKEYVIIAYFPLLEMYAKALMDKLSKNTMYLQICEELIAH